MIAKYLLYCDFNFLAVLGAFWFAGIVWIDTDSQVLAVKITTVFHWFVLLCCLFGLYGNLYKATKKIARALNENNHLNSKILDDEF